MLKSILKEVSNTRMFSKSLIANNLNISETMVEDMVNQLVRMGYLKEDSGSPTCDTPCSRCPYSSVCNTTPIKTLYITTKGKKLLGKN